MKNIPLFAGAAVMFAVCADPAAAQAGAAVVRTQLDSSVVLMRGQGFVAQGAPLTGRLAESGDEEFTLRLNAGTAYMVVGVCSERCSDLDLVLSLDGEEVESDLEMDDVPMLAVEPERSGSYVLSVSMATCSADSCDFGVRVFAQRGDAQSVVRETPSTPPGLAQIRSGQTVRGTLAETDPQAGDKSYYDAFAYTGGAGERLTISMRSDAFDTYLVIGRVVSGEFERLKSDDDGGEGTNSELVFTLPEAGVYVIRANSLTGGRTGAYTLTMQSGS